MCSKIASTQTMLILLQSCHTGSIFAVQSAINEYFLFQMARFSSKGIKKMKTGDMRQFLVLRAIKAPHCEHLLIKLFVSNLSYFLQQHISY